MMEKKEDPGLSPGARLWVQVEERKGRKLGRRGVALSSSLRTPQP